MKSIFIQTVALVSKRSIFSAIGAYRPFKVIQGHWFGCQSKARMRLPISPS